MSSAFAILNEHLARRRQRQKPSIKRQLPATTVDGTTAPTSGGPGIAIVRSIKATYTPSPLGVELNGTDINAGTHVEFRLNDEFIDRELTMAMERSLAQVEYFSRSKPPKGSAFPAEMTRSVRSRKSHQEQKQDDGSSESTSHITRNINTNSWININADNDEENASAMDIDDTTSPYHNFRQPNSKYSTSTQAHGRRNRPSTSFPVSGSDTGASIVTSYQSEERMDNYSNPPASVFASPAKRTYSSTASQSLNQSLSLSPLVEDDLDLDDTDIFNIQSTKSSVSGHGPSPPSVTFARALRAGSVARSMSNPLRPRINTNSVKKSTACRGDQQPPTRMRIRLGETLDKCVAQFGVIPMQELLDYLIGEADGMKKVNAVIDKRYRYPDPTNG